jgi:hypothetical protein
VMETGEVCLTDDIYFGLISGSRHSPHGSGKFS